MPPTSTAFSSMLEAPMRAMESDTMVPNTPVRISTLLMNLGRLVFVLSAATSVDAMAPWLIGVLASKRRCMRR